MTRLSFRIVVSAGVLATALAWVPFRVAGESNQLSLTTSPVGVGVGVGLGIGTGGGGVLATPYAPSPPQADNERHKARAVALMSPQSAGRAVVNMAVLLCLKDRPQS